MSTTTLVNASTHVTRGRLWLLWVILAFAFVYTLAPEDTNPAIMLLLGEMQVAFAFIHWATWAGWRTALIGFVIVFGVSYLSEFIGTHTGLIFGDYFYSDTLLGPLVFDVPPLVMLAYFAMGYTSYVLARIIAGGGIRGLHERITGWRLVLVAGMTALIMTFNDLALDPISSTIKGDWTWENGGAYFGVPIHNFYGWVGTVFVFSILVGLLMLRTKPAEMIARPVPMEFAYQAVVMYVIFMGSTLVQPLLGNSGEIYTAMFMIASLIMMLPILATLAALTRPSDTRAK
ncbi:MAG TPA: carotenoid biosynthesis protein [Candidatus Nanopelagicales bacterium]|nr:carotenoid biosynthesis protein [Candidatus Nanopelagicales bacterium]